MVREPRGSTEGATLRAPVMEVFASIQGEGLFVGEPQVFVRLRGCPLRCRWCDTPGSWPLAGTPRLRVTRAAAGRAPRGAAPTLAAPPDLEADGASSFQIATWVSALDPGARRSVSVTGGEPLLWPELVRELKTFLAPRRVHLETAAAHPRALARVLERVDHVSLDLKLPADLDQPVDPPGPEREPSPRDAREWSAVRREVLRLVDGRDACAKLVLAGGRPALLYEPLLDDLARHAARVPLVIQPVTPQNGVAAPSRAELEDVVERALERGLVVRVLPQVHRALRLP